MSKPVRLAKVEEPTNNFDLIISWAEAWVLSHATLCLIVVSCLLIALFVTLIFALIGISATESGLLYNGWEKII